MNKIFFFLLGVTIIVASCNQNKAYKTNKLLGIVDEYDNENIDTIHIDKIPEKSLGLYSDIYSDVQYITLESSSNSMIGNIDKIQITKSNDLLIFDQNSRVILLFDSNGNFKNKIGNVGHAENEYVEPLDVAYDEYNDNIVVYDNSKKVLSIYDMDGKYLRSIRLNNYISSIEILDSKHIVLFNNYRTPSTSKEVPNYVTINQKGEVIKEYAFYNQNMNGMMMYSDVFYKKDGRLFCHIPYTPIVNEITLNSFTASYFIDFDEFQIPNEWLTQGYEVYHEKVLRLPANKVVSDDFIQIDRQTLMTFSYCNEKEIRRKYLMIANNEELSNPHIYSALINDMYGKQGSINMKYAYTNKVYNVIDPSHISSFDSWESGKDISDKMAEACRKVLKKLPANDPIAQDIVSREEFLKQKTTKIVVSDEEKKMINDLMKSGNPVIQVCTLK